MNPHLVQLQDTENYKMAEQDIKEIAGLRWRTCSGWQLIGLVAASYQLRIDQTYVLEMEEV